MGQALRFVLLGCVLSPLFAQEPQAAEWPVVDGQGREFLCREAGREEREAFSIVRLLFPSPVETGHPANNIVPADYYLPRGAGADGKRRPGVVVLHILNGNFELARMGCAALAARGVPALMLKLPYYGERALPGGRRELLSSPGLFLAGLAQGLEDVGRALDVLGSRPEIDPGKLGLFGVSMGGVLAATAAGREPRVQRAMLVLAGGDLPRIFGEAKEMRGMREAASRLGEEERSRLEEALGEIDPLRHAARLADRARAGRVRMINATEDEVVPRECAEKLGRALGVQVQWLEGLGHYTAVAGLGEILDGAAEFFAQDLPEGTRVPSVPRTGGPPHVVLARLLGRLQEVLFGEVEAGEVHRLVLEADVRPRGQGERKVSLSLTRGAEGRFRLDAQVPGTAALGLGWDGRTWLAAPGKRVFRSRGEGRPFERVGRAARQRIQVLQGLVGGALLAPAVLEQVVEARWEAQGGELCLTRKGRDRDRVRIRLVEEVPTEIELSTQEFTAQIRFIEFKINVPMEGNPWAPPGELQEEEVEEQDLHRMIGALADFLAEESSRPGASDEPLQLVRADPSGHGLLARKGGKRVLMLAGSPREMGAAHGRLLRRETEFLVARTLYLVGAGDTIAGGVWFPRLMGEIHERTVPHIPRRFLEECDALGEAAGIPRRDIRFANLFPERFHCSGAAVRGSASVGGRVLHVRVLDYMRDIGLQDGAVIVLFMPEGGHAWLSQGYAGLVGTVTAMNDKGLAVGEIGGRGQGEWDGTPMTFLLREIMERASSTAEALALLEQSKRTCEYYYVFSDRSGAIAGVHCEPGRMRVLAPGEKLPELPSALPDTVFISGGERARLLGERLAARHGKIDVEGLIEIVTRPVAMASNLHNAIFAPESLEMWAADAGARTPACDEPYVRFQIDELKEFFRSWNTTRE